MKTNRTLLCMACLLLVSSLCFADTFSFAGDTLSSVQAKGKEKTILTGNAQITSGATTINANKIEIFGSDNRYAFCTGNVRVVDEERGILLSSESLFYDRQREVSRVEGYQRCRTRGTRLW